MENKNHRLLLIAAIIISAIATSGCEEEMFIDEQGNLVPKTVDQDPELPSITVNGAQLHSEAFGSPDSTLIIVLHGGPGCDYRYLLKCREFANQGYRVVFYDQRGSGLSQRFPKSSYSMNVMLDELEAVIGHYRVSASQKVYLLGQSWGAMLATAYVNENPEEIDGLILCEPGGLVWDDVVDYMGRIRDVDITSELMNDVTYMDQFMTGKEKEHEILDYKFSLISLVDGENNIFGNEEMVPIWRLGAICNIALFERGNDEEPDWTTNLHQFNTEVLFMYSQNNKAYGRDWAARVSSAYPHVQLFEVMGAGHDMLTFDTGWNNAFPVMMSYLDSLK